MLKTPYTGNKHSNTWTKTRRPAIFGEVSHEIKNVKDYETTCWREFKNDKDIITL